MPGDGAAPEEATAIRRPVKSCPECNEQYSSDSMFCPFDGTKLEDMIWVAPTDPTVDPLLRTLVDGRYRVERVLGEGGTGTVYEVLHESLGRRFAMKVLRREVAADAAIASRFIQEARATASLKHPHIVSITDFGRLPDTTPYFVMERLVGQTLAHVCNVGGQLPVDRSVHIVLQVADALAAAHDAGIVHRDLKPENLFLVGRIDGESKGGDDVRVVDFGAAKISGATRITKTGIVFGTPHYMSPEQASGQPVDHRADIYALGVIMYELFSGHLPFQADTLMGVLTKHMFVEPAPFAEVGDPEASRLLGALEAVTLRALAKKPEHRFQTMAALAAELERTVSFGEEGRVALAEGWKPQPRRRSVRPIGELSRALEGPDRADVYPSGDAGVIPQTSWRTPALVVAAILVGATAPAVLAARRPPPVAAAVASVPPVGSVASPPAASASAPVAAVAPSAATAATSEPISSAAPSPALATVHLTTIPPFAEVWQDGHRVGTAPFDLPIDPGGSATRCNLRAPGYTERALVVQGPQQGSTMVVRLAPAAPTPGPSRSRKLTSRHSDELVDPFSR